MRLPSRWKRSRGSHSQGRMQGGRSLYGAGVHAAAQATALAGQPGRSAEPLAALDSLGLPTVLPAEHLGFSVASRKRPTVTEHDRLPWPTVPIGHPSARGSGNSAYFGFCYFRATVSFCFLK